MDKTKSPWIHGLLIKLQFFFPSRVIAAETKAVLFWDCSSYSCVFQKNAHSKNAVHVLLAEVTCYEGAPGSLDRTAEPDIRCYVTGSVSRARFYRQNFHKRTHILRIPSKSYSVYSVHSAARKQNRTLKNTNIVYSECSSDTQKSTLSCWLSSIVMYCPTIFLQSAEFGYHLRMQASHSRSCEPGRVRR